MLLGALAHSRASALGPSRLSCGSIGASGVVEGVVVAVAAAVHGRTSACSGAPSGSFGSRHDGQPLALRRRTAHPGACPQVDTEKEPDSSWWVSAEE